MSVIDRDFFGLSSDALFSPCGRFRYRLHRIWDRTKPIAFVGMLNPSKAGAVSDDPTIAVLRGHCSALGFGGFVVGNQGAYIATDPADLFALPLRIAIGDDNDDHLISMIEQCDAHICAWGARSLPHRDSMIVDMIYRAGGKPTAFALTARHCPRHPLRMKRPVELVEYARL